MMIIKKSESSEFFECVPKLSMVIGTVEPLLDLPCSILRFVHFTETDRVFEKAVGEAAISNPSLVPFMRGSVVSHGSPSINTERISFSTSWSPRGRRPRPLVGAINNSARTGLSP